MGLWTGTIDQEFSNMKQCSIEMHKSAACKPKTAVEQFSFIAMELIKNIFLGAQTSVVFQGFFKDIPYI